MPLLSPILQERSTPAWLSGLERGRFEQSPLPLSDILSDCAYYPACGFDGFPVKYISKAFSSFVYADYGISFDKLVLEIEKTGFDGYDAIFCRSIDRDELDHLGWRPSRQFLQHVDVRERMPRYRDFMRLGFAAWTVFSRQRGKGDEHGPERFSLLYIGADGVATYDALFKAHKTAPTYLCLIRPGHGFGGNYTNFQDERGLLASVVLETGSPTPQYLISDYHGENHQGCWPAAYPYYHGSTPGTNVQPGLWSRAPLQAVGV